MKSKNWCEMFVLKLSGIQIFLLYIYILVYLERTFVPNSIFDILNVNSYFKITANILKLVISCVIKIVSYVINK